MLYLLFSLLLITLVNVLAYFWAYRNQSDHLTDISYSFCFIVVSVYFLLSFWDLTYPRILLFTMVTLWAIRLGGFLFYRIHHMGRDARFDEFRDSKKGFLKFWILQSISIWIIALPVIVGLMEEITEIIWPSVAMWLAGWLIESIADYQKFSFKARNKNDKFIDSGLYKYIRHPNYLGEIMVWCGVFWYITPIISWTNWFVVASPLWVIFLLIKVSGIPLIEKTYDSKYGSDIKFREYFAKSWRLLPWIY